MPAKTKTSLVMKIVAVVLILASAAMLFLPWMKVSVSMNGMTLSGSEIVQMSGQSMDAVRMEIREEANELAEDAQWDYGIQLDAEKLVDTMMLIVRFSWSPFSLSKLLGNVRSLTPQLMRIVEQESGYMSATFQEASSKLGLARIVLMILLILTLAMAAVAVVCALTDHKLGMIPYLVFALILLVLFIVLIAVANNHMGEIGALMDAGDEFANSVSLRIGVGGILCLVFAVLGFVAMFLPIGKREVAYAGAPTRAMGWICPGCGAKRKAGEQFCLNCGARRPEPVPTRPAVPAGWKCPTCGTMLKADQRFCLYCGTKQPEQAAPAGDGMFAQKGPAAGSSCAKCGAPLKANQKFCPACGAKQPEAAAPAPVTRAPAGWTCPGCGAKLKASQKFCRVPAGWTCPTCGAKLKASQKFCPTCGAKQPETAAPAAPAGWTCPGCGSKLLDSQKFCPRCGMKKPEPVTPAPAPAKAPAVCAACGTTLLEGMPFCPKCGTRVEQPKEELWTAPAIPAEEPAAPKEETPIPFVPETPAVPEEPAAPAIPDVPSIPEVPVIPEAPVIPAPPVNPEPPVGGFQVPGDDDL